MKHQIIYQDLGLIEYKEAWDIQENLFDQFLAIKAGKTPAENLPSNTLFFCEHPHVYTLGKSGEANNLLINDAFLKKINATYYKTNRGGDITYHGPGQIVGYPILDIENFGLGVKQYIYNIERVIINTLSEYEIEANSMEGATGVWLDKDLPQKARKICAIGVKASRYVTMHGFAFNINTDLAYFNHINPCGFTDKGVTSLANELGKQIPLNEVKEKLIGNFKTVFNTEVIVK